MEIPLKLVRCWLMNSLSASKKKKLGFSLLELLVAVAIIGIIGAIGIPTYQGYIEDSRDREAQSALRTIASAQETYRLVTGQYYGTQNNSSNCSASSGTTNALNAYLFNNNKNLNFDNFYYCVGVYNTSRPPRFYAIARRIGSTKYFRIDHLGNTVAVGWSSSTF